MFRSTNQGLYSRVDKTIFHDSCVSTYFEWIALVAIAVVLVGGLFVLQEKLTFSDIISAFIFVAHGVYSIPCDSLRKKVLLVQLDSLP